MANRPLLAELRVLARVELIPTVKMTAASLGAQLGFNLEEIDELKIAVAQACASTIEEADQLWESGAAILHVGFSSTERGIAVDVEAIPPDAATAAARRSTIRPTGRPLTSPLEAERALQRDMIRLFVDDFRQQVDSGRGHIRFRMVKYLIS
jgi:hypothetical protein